MPRVSVVVPAYQSMPFLTATLDSIMAQTYLDREVIIADHSSSDGSWEAIQRYAERPGVSIMRTPTGGGAEANWNAVSAAATGELIKLVCADDLVYPELLRRQVEAVDAYGTRIALVASSRDVIDARGRRVIDNVGLGGLRGLVDGRKALRHSVLQGANIFGEPGCVLLRREVLERIGGWHGNPGFMIDQATYSRALLHGDLVAVPGPLAAFRISGNQWSVQLSQDQSHSAAELHRQLAELEPGLLSTWDVWRGDVMAAGRALQRRLVYAWLGRRRMSPAPLPHSFGAAAQV